MSFAVGTHPTPDQLEAFDRGDVVEPYASAIEDHLATCPDCLARLSESSSQDYLVGLVRVAAGGERAEPPPQESSTAPTGYDLIEPIGRGGMGVVFKARQRALGRLVALKQIRAGLDADPKELARFRAEAEAVARLTHPNVVRVFDVGVQDGLPYIAMELVEGESLADRLRAGPLRPTEAAALVETLARAIAHAHENGVVHRDLKPGNVLLAGDLTPRVVDFGLVKLEGAAESTRTGMLIGTPRYMSPEQARGGRTGPASDIHALGAILYECLAGRPPFQGTSPHELLDRIQNQEPTPPVGPGSRPPRDLRTICMKCLEKDPRRRYIDAGALADDLGRFLRSEPILARAVGPLGRLAKWVRRRPYQAALAAFALLATIGAFVGLLVHQARLQEEVERTTLAVEEAREQRAAADANYREARATIRAVLDCFEDPAFDQLPRFNDLRKAQTEKALLFYDRLLTETAASNPLLPLDAARASREAGTLQYVVGRDDDAVAGLERSLRLIDAVRAKTPNDPDADAEEVQSRVRLGLFLARRKDSADRATDELSRAAEIAERIVATRPGSTDARTNLAWCLHNLGSVLIEQRRVKEAVAAHRRAIEINRELAAENPTDLRRRGVLAENLSNFGLLLAPEDPDGAEAVYAEAAALLEASLRDDPRRRRWVLALGSVMNNWGNLAAVRKRSELAFDRFQRGLTLVEDPLRLDPNDSMFRNSALNLHGARGNLLCSLSRHGESIPDWNRVVELEADPERRVGYRLLRALALVKSGGYARAVAEVEDLARSGPGAVGSSGSDLYNYACVLALASTAVGKDARLDPAERGRLARAYADSAVARLERATKAGFFDDPKNRELAGRDADLAPLRDRPDFRKLVETAAP